MTNRRVLPLNTSTLEADEIAAAKAVLDSGMLTMGRLCLEFEAAFARFVGAKHAIFVNSGSSANLLALFAMLDPVRGDRAPRGIKPGDEVIVPALTWATTIWPVIQAGAVPVFVDCDPATLQMQPEAIEAAIGPKTRAVIVVHVLGGAVEMPAVRDIAKKHGLWLMEDSCESLGVYWDQKHVGTFGDVGTFSFYFAHHITTIEGGMVVTDDDYFADLLRAQRSHGWIKHMQNPAAFVDPASEIDKRFLFVTTGFNVRPNEINAAIGLKQLPRLESFNLKRREIGWKLDAALAGLIADGKLSVMRFPQKCSPAPFGYPVLARTNAERNALQAHLEADGVETRPVICGNMVRHQAMRHVPYRVSGKLDGSDKVMDCGLYFGAHPMMTDEDIEYVVDNIRRFYK
ncbi:MAG TPA: DegT/DnrJ/EryC1/StrS family aminotransferase [Hyphomonadaceae bacterium]|nr:DegT/DnrJ/EryC1/StrS family aminotransferase [Hyphomonadaceae bacterium]